MSLSGQRLIIVPGIMEGLLLGRCCSGVRAQSAAWTERLDAELIWDHLNDTPEQAIRRLGPLWAGPAEPRALTTCYCELRGWPKQPFRQSCYHYVRDNYTFKNGKFVRNQGRPKKFVWVYPFKRSA